MQIRVAVLTALEPPSSFPRRHRGRHRPHPTALHTRISLYRIERRVFWRVANIDPGHPAADLLRVRVVALAANRRQHAAISVATAFVQRRFLAKAELSERLAGPCAEVLPQFGRVDVG